jgi:hypothetical protein
LTRLLLSLLILASEARLAYGDGGALIFHQQAGSLNISVFASPSPLRAGMADLSVLLQDADTDAVRLDASVEIHLLKAGEPELVATPTPGQATNKLLYAAAVEIPSEGEWKITLRCIERGHEAVVQGILTVLPPEPALLTYWIYFVIVPIAIALFILNQRLKQKRRAARLPARR